MASDDHIDAVDRGRNVLVDAVAGVAEDDDAGDAFGLEFGDFTLHRFDGIMEGDVLARRGDAGGILGREADQSDLLAGPFDDHGGFQDIGELRFARHIRIGHEHRELDRLHEPAQHLRPVVELMIADRHGVITDGVHHFRCRLALIAGVEERSLKLVAAVHKYRIGPYGPGRPDHGEHARRPTEALADVILLWRTGVVEARYRFDAAVKVVCVQNGQGLGGGGPR